MEVASSLVVELAAVQLLALPFAWCWSASNQLDEEAALVFGLGFVLVAALAPSSSEMVVLPTCPTGSALVVQGLLLS